MKAECDWPSSVQCGTRPVTVQPSSGGSSNRPSCTCPFGKKECYSTDMSSCNRFIHCSNGTRYTKPCPGSLRWNTVKNFCDWPTDTNCGNRFEITFRFGSLVIFSCRFEDFNNVIILPDQLLWHLEAQVLDHQLEMNVPAKVVQKNVTWKMSLTVMDFLFAQVETSIKKHALGFFVGPPLKIIVNGPILFSVGHAQ